MNDARFDVLRDFGSTARGGPALRMAEEILRLRADLADCKRLHVESERVSQRLDKLWQQMADALGLGEEEEEIWEKVAQRVAAIVDALQWQHAWESR